MTLITKPDFTYVWASGGAVVAPNDTKKQLGWVAEAPPFQYDNWLQNRQDQMLAHINQRGIAAWDALTNYEVGGLSYVQGSDGKVYKSVSASGPSTTSQDPTTDTSDVYWKLAFLDTSTIGIHAPVIGSSLSLEISIPTASASATVQATEIVVGESLTGIRYKLSNFSKTINLSTVGVNGMDTGLAPISGYISIYAIYNSSTGASGLLATNTTSIASTEVYSGVNMPAGYTASALLSIWRTDATRLMVIGLQRGRRVETPFVGLLDINTEAVPPTSLTIAGYAPISAKTLSGQSVCVNTGESNTGMVLDVLSTSTNNGVGSRYFNTVTLPSTTTQIPFSDLPIITPQTIYHIRTTTALPARFQILGSGYTF